MPIVSGVLTWWRCRANARTYGQRTDRRSSPCRRNASGSAISATDRDTDGGTVGACALWTRWTRRNVRTQTSPVTRQPSKPTISTEWQLGTLNGFVGLSCRSRSGLARDGLGAQRQRMLGWTGLGSFLHFGFVPCPLSHLSHLSHQNYENRFLKLVRRRGYVSII